MQAEKESDGKNSLSGKTLLVTGGSRGIGAATAMLAAQQGYSVCVNFLSDATAATEVVSQIEQQGGEAFAFRADISREPQVNRLFAAVDETFGPITALVNNAGILDRRMRLEAMEQTRLERVFAVNIIGSFLCAREAVKRMSTRNGGGGGSIVNLSSSAARLGSPDEFVDYAASKGAIDTFTIGLAREVAAEGIRVNAVRPGLVHTDMHVSSGEPGRVERIRGTIPMQRGAQPEEVARSILWLLSDEASYATGSLLDVAGGR